MADKGFCLHCGQFYDDTREPFGKCPKGHPLLHKAACQKCGAALYFQTDDDYCGPSEYGIICEKCAKEIAEGK